MALLRLPPGRFNTRHRFSDTRGSEFLQPVAVPILIHDQGGLQLVIIGNLSFGGDSGHPDSNRLTLQKWGELPSLSPVKVRRESAPRERAAKI